MRFWWYQIISINNQTLNKKNQYFVYHIFFLKWSALKKYNFISKISILWKIFKNPSTLIADINEKMY